MRRRGLGLGRRAGILPFEIRQAHDWLFSGQFNEAARAFEALAHRAEENGGPRAPIFWIQAGKAQVASGNVVRGTQYLQHGLTLLVESGRFSKLYHFGQQAISELRQRGLEHEAAGLEQLLAASLPARANLPTEQIKEPAANLPSHCPSCGGPLNPNEIEWLSAHIAECPYCGSPFQAHAHAS